MFNLKNKVAIVTGSEGGIGKAIFNSFKKSGAKVFGLDVKNGIDITNTTEVEQFFINNITKVDILVNCAGITFRNRTSETFLDEEWDKTLKVNLTTPFKMCQTVFPFMYEKGGSIINITSIWTKIVLNNNPAYGASKGGLEIMSRALSLDWAKYNIRVNNISLGLMKTDMTKGTCEDKEKLNKRLNRIPLNRIGEPDDVVGATLLLASDFSKYITGSTITIDGGWSINGE